MPGWYQGGPADRYPGDPADHLWTSPSPAAARAAVHELLAGVTRGPFTFRLSWVLDGVVLRVWVNADGTLTVGRSVDALRVMTPAEVAAVINGGGGGRAAAAADGDGS